MRAPHTHNVTRAGATPWPARRITTRGWPRFTLGLVVVALVSCTGPGGRGSDPEHHDSERGEGARDIGIEQDQGLPSTDAPEADSPEEPADVEVDTEPIPTDTNVDTGLTPADADVATDLVPSEPSDGADGAERDADRDGDGGEGDDTDACGGGDCEPAEVIPPELRVSYSEAHFSATHNSYSGNHSGERGSLISQLDSGVRYLELDFHENDFEARSYRVGHFTPGNEVSHEGGNPLSDDLGIWLAQIAEWSATNPGHAPVTVSLDAKDDLTDNPSYDAGNPARLNALLESQFGARLFRADDLSTSVWPTVAELRERVIVVLSGHEGTRLAYLRDHGFNPAVAVNAEGRVVEVHDSGSGDLWYWTGQMDSEGGVRWQRHGCYDTGENPAVALNDEGVLVEVHQDPDFGDEQLWYRVGELGEDYEILWSDESGRAFPGDDSGVEPSVRFDSPGGLDVREIHRSERTGEPWYWAGSVDPRAGTVSWARDGGDGGRSDREPFDTDDSRSGDLSVHVASGSEAPFGEAVLSYRVGGATSQLITYAQLAFVEVQRGGSAALFEADLEFFAATASSSSARAWATAQRAAGGIVRLWGTNDASHETTPPVNFSATDHPRSAWYLSFCAAIGCLE